MQEIIIESKDAGQRLDKLLKKHLPEAGSSFLYKMLRKKNIVLNGKKAEGKELLAAGDHVTFFFSEETCAKFRGITGGSTQKAPKETNGREAQRTTEENGREGRKGSDTSARRQREERAKLAYEEIPEIRVLYENEHLLFVDKPAGYLSQSDATKELTLNDWIYGYALSKGIVKGTDNYIPSIANRLDRNTSGIVMAALTYAGSRFLSEMIRDHRLRKYYEAVAEGRIEKDGELKGYLYKDPETNKVRVLAAPENNAEIDRNTDAVSGQGATKVHKAVPGQGTEKTGTEGDGNKRELRESMVHTCYHVVSYEKGYTHLEVELITGKSHQIRAHLSSIGHPIAGDLKYGGHPYRGRRIQQLRAVRVEFPVLDNDPFDMSSRIIEA